MAPHLAHGHHAVSGFSSAAEAVSLLEKNQIAQLPLRFISDMSRDELIHVIHAAHLPLVDSETLRRLPFIERAALERLAHLARRACRTQQSQCGDGQTRGGLVQRNPTWTTCRPSLLESASSNDKRSNQ
jgi:hypothetical protein